MRLFLGGSSGLVFYEDEETTPLYTQPVACLVKSSATRLVAGTDEGAVVVYESNNGGTSSVVAKDIGEGIYGIAANNKGHLFAGTIPAGLWMSKDQGERWREVAAFAGAPNSERWHAPWGSAVLSAIAAHPKDSKTLFCGVEVGGLYRTRDQGKTWFDLDIPCPDVHSVQISSSRPERVYVTTGAGFFSSDDEGFSWREPSVAHHSGYAMGLSAHPSEPERVIISSAAGPPPTWGGKEGAMCSVHLSTDGGRRFRTVAKGLRGAVQRKALVVNQKVPSEVVFGTSDGRLFYSNDGGESFDLMAQDLGDLRSIVFA